MDWRARLIEWINALHFSRSVQNSYLRSRFVISRKGQTIAGFRVARGKVTRLSNRSQGETSPIGEFGRWRFACCSNGEMDQLLMIPFEAVMLCGKFASWSFLRLFKEHILACWWFKPLVLFQETYRRVAVDVMFQPSRIRSRQDIRFRWESDSRQRWCQREQPLRHSMDRTVRAVDGWNVQHQ